MINKENIITINKLDDEGRLVNESSLDFALAAIQTTKDWVTQLAYLLRAILLDHVFEDGNKRTGLAITLAYVTAHKKAYDIYKLDLLIKRIIEQKTHDIKKIREMIQNAVW